MIECPATRALLPVLQAFAQFHRVVFTKKITSHEKQRKNHNVN